ncbi:MAG: prenyltransferase/squalene oxidase repeat-containing protein [Candidatus Helarchaeota archaeon]
MSEKKHKPKTLIVILILILLPLSTLVGLLFYTPPRHFSSEFITNVVNETGEYALTFQTSNGLFIEPSIQTIFHTVSTFSLLNNTGPFVFSALNLENLTHFALTRFNLDGGYSDFAGTGNMDSTYGALFTVNLTAPSALISNPSQMNLTTQFINASRNDDGGYTLRPPLELPEEFNFDLGYDLPFGNLTTDLSNLENTFQAIELLALLGISPYNANATSNFINISCRRTFPSLSFPAGFSTTKFTLEPDLHSTYFGVATLRQLGYLKSAIDKPFSNITRFIELCWNSTDGGFAAFPGNASDITSTYYGVAALSLLDYNFTASTVINLTKLLNFIGNSQQADGGIGARPELQSTFQSAHHAIATLNLLGAISPINLTLLYSWFLAHRAINGLFGDILVEAQYWGVASAFLSEKENSLNSSSIVAFLEECQNPAGGFGAIPNSTSSVVDTYAAIETLRSLGGLSQINRTAAINWLQSLQTQEGGFAAYIGIDAFLQSYAPIYGFFTDFMLDETKPSTEASFFALASLKRLQANPLNQTSLKLWLLSAQNADGGFPFTIGIRSDAVSTFYSVQALDLLNLEPFSSQDAVDFLKGCQMSDGGFSFYPLIGDYINISYLFIGFTASKAIYLLSTQPNDVFGAMDWFLTCQDETTKGFGDQPGFGADLRNSPYVINIVQELNIDRSFSPDPWIQTMFWLLITEFSLFGTYGIFRIIKRHPRTRPHGIRRTHPNIEEYPAIHVQGLTIKIGKKVILEDISMTLHHGEVLGVIGESGAGKSTFVKAILGTKASIGDIKIYGFNIRKEKKRLKPLFGYVPQDLSKIYENFTVMENLLHFGKQYGISEAEIIERGTKILRDLGILDKADALVSELSGGQRRRASIAGGMIHQPTLFILDEPTSGLDPIIREQLWINLIDLAERNNTTLVVITHYPEESKFCTKVAIFGRKRGMIDFGHPRDLIKNLPGAGRTIEISLDPKIGKITIDLLPLLKKISKFVLEEKRGIQYRIFSDLPMTTLKQTLIKALGTDLIHVKQSEATLVDYFRIKSLEVTG